MADLPENPNNREEEYLADMAGENGTKPANPWSRKEAYLDAIDGRMDGIEEQIAALATDISLKGSVASQADLPETAAVGDAYITEDTGIMYVYVGESGTEPWVALGGSGGGGEGIKTLTEADYNYPTDNPQAIAMWLLDSGYYKVKYTNGVQPKIIGGTSMSSTYEYNDGAILPIWDAFNAKVSIWSNYNAAGTLIKSYLVYSSGLGSYAYSQELSLPTVVQTTGTSTTSLMSQNATTSMVFADPSTKNRIVIGSGASTSQETTVVIGSNASVTGADSHGGIAIGPSSSAKARGSIAIGEASTANSQGEFNIGTSNKYRGYNSTNYRLITGVHDPVNDHDAATKGYVDAHSNSIVLYVDTSELVDSSQIEFYKDSSLTTKWTVGEVGDSLHNGASVTLVSKKTSESGDYDVRKNYQMIHCYYPYIIDDDKLNETEMRMVFQLEIANSHISQFAIQTGAPRSSTAWHVYYNQL